MFPGAGEEMSQADQDRFNRFLMDQQVRDSQRTYNHISEKCFEMCVNDFRTRSLDKKEAGCVGKCALKYMNAVSRCGLRFQEQNMATQNQM